MTNSELMQIEDYQVNNFVNQFSFNKHTKNAFITKLFDMFNTYAGTPSSYVKSISRTGYAMGPMNYRRNYAFMLGYRDSDAILSGEIIVAYDPRVNENPGRVHRVDFVNIKLSVHEQSRTMADAWYSFCPFGDNEVPLGVELESNITKCSLSGEVWDSWLSQPTPNEANKKFFDNLTPGDVVVVLPSGASVKIDITASELANLMTNRTEPPRMTEDSPLIKTNEANFANMRQRLGLIFHEAKVPVLDWEELEKALFSRPNRFTAEMATMPTEETGRGFPIPRGPMFVVSGAGQADQLKGQTKVTQYVTTDDFSFFRNQLEQGTLRDIMGRIEALEKKG